MDRTKEALATLASYTKDLLEQLDDQIDLSHVEEYQQAIEALDYEGGFFKITSVHRDDLENLGYDTSEVTDETMERLAGKMCDDYVEQLFHDSLDIIAGDYFEIPKKLQIVKQSNGYEAIDCNGVSEIGFETKEELIQYLEEETNHKYYD